MSKPVRLQRSRRKGSKLTSPNGLPIVCVTRPSKYSNPYRLQDYPTVMPESERRAHSLRSFRGVLIGEIADPIHVLPFTVEDVRRELAGKNLACWCPLDKPCHADVLLDIANAEAN